MISFCRTAKQSSKAHAGISWLKSDADNHLLVHVSLRNDIYSATSTVTCSSAEDIVAGAFCLAVKLPLPQCT